MLIEPLSIEGAYRITPKQFPDSRGLFLEAFKQQAFVEAVGRELDVQQVNTSVSKAGTVRGIHFAEIAPSQAKYVMCPQGALLDFVVDIRVGSPTFGQYESVLLDDADRRAIFISEGLGHAFIALEDNTVATYLCSAPYAPGREHGVKPTCSTLGIEWPTVDRHGNPMELLLSEKDTAAPGLGTASRMGLLPTYEEAMAFVNSLKK
ncbi:dTDP-4-dehydrorhamnose 3,5-epimerase family protein [Arcanobacterium haemolyticum]